MVYLVGLLILLDYRIYSCYANKLFLLLKVSYIGLSIKFIIELFNEFGILYVTISTELVSS